MKFPFEDEDHNRLRCNIAAAIIGAGALGAGASIYGANKASSSQKDALNSSLTFQDQLFKMLSARADPFITAGSDALSTLKGLITPGPNQTSVLNNIPGFSFAQDWGQKAVQNLGTMRGLGGNVLKAGSEYATGVAQQGWSSIVNALQSLVNSGTGALGTLTGAGNNYSANSLSALTGIGNAGAGGATATGNAVGNFANSISTAAILQKLTGQSSPGTTPGIYKDIDLATGNPLWGGGTGGSNSEGWF